MRILLYTDTHGNKQALQCLKRLEDWKSADMRIFLGDAIGLGPDTNYSVSFTQKYSDVCVLGNNDSYPVFGITKEEEKPKPPIKLEHILELKEELTDKNKESIKSWVKEYVMTVGNKKLRFLHFPWKSETEMFDIPEEFNIQEYVKLFGLDYDYTFFGHFHYKFDFEYKGKKFYCVGSTGLKYPAQYTIINIQGNSITVENKIFEFDIKKFRNRLYRCKHKSAKDFVKTRLEKYLGGSLYSE